MLSACSGVTRRPSRRTSARTISASSWACQPSTWYVGLYVVAAGLALGGFIVPELLSGNASLVVRAIVGVGTTTAAAVLFRRGVRSLGRVLNLFESHVQQR